MNFSRFHFINTIALQGITFLMCSVAIGSMPNNAPAADDAYLNALEAEASNSARLTKKAHKKQGKKRPDASSGNAKQAKDAADNNMQLEFEQTLANKRPATYTFYKKLPEKEKSAVLETFKNSKKISTTSKKIFDLYFAMTKK